MEKVKIYAPVVIPTCNRYQHLKDCVESLAACKYAEETELYISVDYPPNENYISGWEKVKEYVKDIRGFKEVHVWLQDSNLGPCYNGNMLIDKVFEKYDYLIFTEDDNVFAPAYLDYMNKMLVRFEKDPKIFSIAGFSRSNLNYSSKIYKNYTFQPWGNGKWKNKWYFLKNLNQPQIYEKYSKKILKIIQLYFDNKWLFCAYVGCLLRENSDPEMRDATQTLLFYLLGYQSIFPIKSLVKNNGFDESGQTCRKEAVPDIDKVELDCAPVFEYNASQKIPTYRGWYLPIPEWAKRSSKLSQDPLTYLLYLVMGKERYKKWRKRKGF